VIVRYETDIASGSVWYTDANGEQMMKRTRDARESYPLTCTQPVACNYMPVGAMAYIDEVGARAAPRRLTVAIDRSEGCASLVAGELEFLIHRRLRHPDRWTREALDDDARIVVLHRLLVSAAATPADMTAPRARMHALALSQPMVVLFGLSQGATIGEWRKRYTTDLQLLAQELPPNVRLRSFEAGTGGRVIVRLSHTDVEGEGDPLAVNATVQLGDIIGNATCAAIQSVEETTVGANALISSVLRLKWRVMGESGVDESKNQQNFLQLARASSTLLPPAACTAQIVLRPGCTRTFVMQF
jgi:hypothetical protein